MKVYVAGPISGKTADETFAYFEGVESRLEAIGFEVLTPMKGKNHLRKEGVFKPSGYTYPLSTNHAIFNRDHWMVSQADVILVNLLESERVSIGSMFELAWASHMDKHVVVVMPEEGIHTHSFVLEAANVIFRSLDEAITYLTELL